MHCTLSFDCMHLCACHRPDHVIWRPDILVVATSKYACVLYDAVADNNEKVVFLTQFYIEFNFKAHNKCQCIKGLISYVKLLED